MNSDAGLLPEAPPAWLRPHRLRTKFSAPCVRQLYEGHAFVAMLASRNDLDVIAGLILWGLIC